MTRKKREAREKAEDETTERARTRVNYKARYKADISSLADEARDKTEFKARVR